MSDDTPATYTRDGYGADDRGPPFHGFGVPDRADYCPRCKDRLERIVRIARQAATQVVVGKVEADAIAAEAERLARVELAAANGCWG